MKRYKLRWPGVFTTPRGFVPWVTRTDLGSWTWYDVVIGLLPDPVDQLPEKSAEECTYSHDPRAPLTLEMFSVPVRGWLGWSVNERLNFGTTWNETLSSYQPVDKRCRFNVIPLSRSSRLRQRLQMRSSPLVMTQNQFTMGLLLSCGDVWPGVDNAHILRTSMPRDV